MLMLHRGAEAIDFAGLREVETPEPTKTHVPIPHHRLVDSVRHSLGYFGHEIVSEEFGVTPDGSRLPSSSMATPSVIPKGPPSCTTSLMASASEFISHRVAKAPLTSFDTIETDLPPARYSVMSA